MDEQTQIQYYLEILIRECKNKNNEEYKDSLDDYNKINTMKKYHIDRNITNKTEDYLFNGTKYYERLISHLTWLKMNSNINGNDETQINILIEKLNNTKEKYKNELKKQQLIKTIECMH